MWLVLGVATIAALLAIIRLLVNVREPSARRPPIRGDRTGAISLIRPTLIGYFLFGLGYIVYVTFIVALLRSNREGDSSITLFWVVLGASAVVGSIVWGLLVDHVSGGTGPALAIATTLVGAALPVLSSSSRVAIASGVIFGSSFLPTATAVIVLARRMLPSSTWTFAIGVLTAAFGIGQCIGPSVAGAISDGPGGIRAGLALSCAFLTAGVVAFAMQRERDTRDGELAVAAGE
jgi:predicted MFS family arabinose efflux permease